MVSKMWGGRGGPTRLAYRSVPTMGGKVEGFGQYMWEDVQGLMEQQGPRVIGYSALAVISDGVHLFRTGMGWKESSGYDGQWVVAQRNTGVKETKIVKKRDWVGVKGRGVVGDCKLLVSLREKMVGQSECRW